MEHLKKISVKTVCGKFDKSKAQKLMQVFGIVDHIEEIETAFGQSLKYVGEFRAANADGQMYESSVAYFPEILGDSINAHIAKGAVEFAAEIGIKPDESVAVGYVYTLKLHHNRESESRLAALEVQMRDAGALPAPSKAPSKTKS